jgi:hypothetical protein
MTHTCAARNCGQTIRDEHLMCVHHWGMVPKHDQGLIYKLYHNRKAGAWPTQEYAKVVQRLVGEVSIREQTGRVDSPESEFPATGLRGLWRGS